MAEEQWWGVAILFVGSYLFVCATWKPDFILYRLKFARNRRLFGEKATHLINQVFGIVLIGVGVLKLLQVI